ncbi:MULTISPECIES: SanA/YdcF family protein [Chryseobacterium]|uniref:SanA/YdcF family protein n=1 Tax=Chryseobacterium TaxID=59732 RepID=UPI00155510BD|nr:MULTISPECIES: ElyC/SanA/YdcF family protein [unclassified Chryseobacterium]MDC8103778.1 YdcF family protein [Chryseobacterium sp. B21-037]MDQ1803386.1 ElyC/SanA/YdcF family protein [Chryseobacterium sp. CKR4-1]WBV57311.1 YdcF family protein [Chryseobacterium daecheongense]
MRAVKNIFNLILTSIEIGILVICLANAWVFALTNGRTYTKISKIPPREVALVLGTSPKMRSGLSNPYFTKRMDATALLYHHGKIRKIIVSGEKSKGYNEPAAMKNYLVYQEGVPEEIIIEDPKGFNTYKSILRCKDVYKKSNVIIVSQGFHNLRALFFARNNNMNALGFDAQDVNKPESYYRNQFREIFARMIAVVYFLLGISPD